MKIEIMTEGTQLKGVTFSHVDSKQEQESVERILVNVFRGENPVVAVENEQNRPIKLYREPIAVESVEKPNFDHIEVGKAPDYDEQLTRAFLVGYYVDENGLATDENGDPLGETIPGKFLRESKNRLHLYDIVDNQNRRYLPVFEDGEEVRRIYADNTEEIKDLISFEIHRCQPINHLFTILTGMPTKNIFHQEDGVDWKKLSYLVGKSILETRDLGKVAFATPLYTKEIMQRNISDYEGWAKLVLQTITEEVTSNLQAQKLVYLLSDAEVEILAAILNPQAWKTIFKSGNINGIIENTINPAGKKIKLMLSYTQTRSEAWDCLQGVIDSWPNFKNEYPSLSI